VPSGHNGIAGQRHDGLPRPGCAPWKEGHQGPQTDNRTRVGASDLQASPLSEGDRRLWAIYIRRQVEAQGERTGGGGVVRLGGQGGEGTTEECSGVRGWGKHKRSSGPRR